MANEVGHIGRRRGIPWRMLGWGTAALVLLLPLVAMQFTGEVNWTQGDFVFAALLIGVVGLMFELTVRASSNIAYRGGVAAALTASFLTIWANGAVGMIGEEGNPYNLLFLGVILIALAGAVVARFQAAGTSHAMLVAAGAQVSIALGGLSTDVRGGVLSMGFALLWLASAALFRRAAHEQVTTGASLS